MENECAQCMKAFNKSTQELLASNLVMADSFYRSLAGLMGKQSLPLGAGLLLVPCQSIHTMCMRFPIDVVFLDKTGKVLHLIENMKPWRVSRHLTKARSVLELPAGTIAATGTKLGDTLEIVNSDSGL